MLDLLSSCTRATTLIHDRRTGATRAAAVAIRVETPAPTEVVWREEWVRVRPPLAPSVGRSWSVLRWRVEGQVVHLAHERFGPGHPTALVRFDLGGIAEGDGPWSVGADEPHPCGPDRYHATLIRGRAPWIEVRWEVVGPESDLAIWSRYALRPGGDTR